MATTNIKDVKLKIGTETQFQSKLKDLPLNTLVGTTDPIQEGELDTSIITKLNKAENALPKPTNDTTGSAGQVLKKTANGSEWGDAPSGGGKLYLHNIQIYDEVRTTTTFLIIYSLSATPFTFSTLLNKIIAQNREVPFSGYVNYPTANKTRSLLYIQYDSVNMVGWANSDDFNHILETAFSVDILNPGNSTLTDTVTEL